MKLSREQKICVVLRIGLGWIFLWAFFDKLFGLGFATTAEKAWIAGSSPTYGALMYGAHGPFKAFFQIIAGTPIVDWLFMLGLLGVGVSFMLGILLRIAGYSAAVMLALMYLAFALPPEHNPIIDEHLIYLVLAVAFTFIPVGKWWGLGEWWERQTFVQRYPWLK